MSTYLAEILIRLSYFIFCTDKHYLTNIWYCHKWNREYLWKISKERLWGTMSNIKNSLLLVKMSCAFMLSMVMALHRSWSDFPFPSTQNSEFSFFYTGCLFSASLLIISKSINDNTTIKAWIWTRFVSAIVSSYMRCNIGASRSANKEQIWHRFPHFTDTTQKKTVEFLY